ncbi:alpha-D-ribose 1-methylphosphonate 5-triphosphate diphosphatase [Pelagibius litoralis]|uniref:alpha-D-ribose 1-methylphosphonate 5-triphosphate diphosphatase n=1 Tax=Pelagibius litoralis TaxID=374515 RepID=UPI001F0F15CF|nr:alpha-D-ribose 1-methylphosphonate 5-triphosphate diphosphatase [Pelagibius litoralis]
MLQEQVVEERESPVAVAAAPLVLANAEVVTAEAAFRGAVTVQGDRITEITEGGNVPSGALDCQGEMVLPGLVDLHTDHCERHAVPRPGVQWDALQAAIAHDAQVAAAGITTVFDSLVVGLRDADQTRRDLLGLIMAAVEKGDALGLFRSQHFLHLRCEVTDPTLLDQVAPHMDHPLLRLVSIMEHTVGQRQFPDAEKYREVLVKLFHVPEDQVEERFRRDAEASRTFAPTYRAAICRMAHEKGISIAAHDDETLEHVEEAAHLGMAISEFPTTLVAAEAARECGMVTIMGAPNVVKGGSQTGNVSAIELARADLLDILASDYVPISMLAAALRLTKDDVGLSLPRAVKMASLAPAQAAGLTDRGEIAVGKRADLLHVRMVEEHPVVRTVYGAGKRVA